MSRKSRSSIECVCRNKSKIPQATAKSRALNSSQIFSLSLSLSLSCLFSFVCSRALWTSQSQTQPVYNITKHTLRCSPSLNHSPPSSSPPTMGRAPCCEKEGLKKGPWTPEEDKILVDYIQSNGHGSWRSLPKLAGLLRCGKSCRLRWTNYLRPDIKRGPFTPEEQKSIVQLHAIVGNKWSTIAAQLPGRTDNEVKNYWNTHLKKRLVKMGIDPDTCTPASNADASGGGGGDGGLLSSKAATRHMSQWESARLEAEARLAKESLMFSTSTTTGAGESESNSGPVKMEADFFLRIWNSDVGRAFRSKDERSAMVPPTSSSSSSSSPLTTNTTTTSSTMATEMTTSSEGEDESYQIFLDFAAVDVDDSMAIGGLFSTTQLGSFSLFDIAGDQMNGGDCSSLDHIDVFNKWGCGNDHDDDVGHRHHHHLQLLEMPASTTT